MKKRVRKVKIIKNFPENMESNNFSEKMSACNTLPGPAGYTPSIPLKSYRLYSFSGIYIVY